MIKHYIPHKNPNEEIILLVRRHWLIFLGYISFWILLAIGPVALYGLAIYFNIFIDNISDEVYALVAFLISLYYIYVCLFAYHAFIDYYLDVWIITNERIVNTEQNGVFSRVTSELSFRNVQDVTIEINGILPTIFNYGNVYIQTAAEKNRFVFEQVADPQIISNKISALVHAYIQSHVKKVDSL